MNSIKEYVPQLTFVLRGVNELHCVCHNPPDNCEFALYIYCDDEEKRSYPYQKEPEFSFWAQESGQYRAKLIVRDLEGNTNAYDSEAIVFERKQEIYCNITPPKRKFDWIRNVWSCLTEIWTNRQRMYRISLFNYKVLNQDAYLGSLWNILNPLIQIGTYWFVFGIGLRGGRDVNGCPYLLWMLAGIIPWFFMSQCITQGAGAIRKRGIVALKMRYPVSTMPLEEVLVALYSHLVMVGALLISFICFGYGPTIYWLNLVYYMLFAIIFFTAFGMVTSVLSMIAVDIQKLINALIRLLFYLTPILWNMDSMPPWIQLLLKLNPCLYVVDGFRDSLIDQIPFTAHGRRIIFFWGLTIVMVVVGSNLQEKYKKYFLDME